MSIFAWKLVALPSDDKVATASDVGSWPTRLGKIMSALDMPRIAPSLQTPIEDGQVKC